MLLLPSLLIYALFLIYPFFRGLWISLHDWNLLAVAFKPDAKEYIGLRNYKRVMWGRASATAVFLFVIMGGFQVIQFVVGRGKQNEPFI